MLFGSFSAGGAGAAAGEVHAGDGLGLDRLRGGAGLGAGGAAVFHGGGCLLLRRFGARAGRDQGQRKNRQEYSHG